MKNCDQEPISDEQQYKARKKSTEHNWTSFLVLSVLIITA